MIEKFCFTHFHFDWLVVHLREKNPVKNLKIRSQDVRVLTEIFWGRQVCVCMLSINRMNNVCMRLCIHDNVCIVIVVYTGSQWHHQTVQWRVPEAWCHHGGDQPYVWRQHRRRWEYGYQLPPLFEVFAELLSLEFRFFHKFQQKAAFDFGAEGVGVGWGDCTTV